MKTLAQIAAQNLKALEQHQKEADEQARGTDSNQTNNNNDHGVSA